MVKINLCQLCLVMVFFIILSLDNVGVEAGKKKEKGLIIVLSNGGCGGNILVQTAGKDGKKGSGHKIVVKGGDSGGGCGCSNSCGSCGGGHEHHTVQHVPIPIPVPAGGPLPPPHEMHAAMMSQLRPVFSADEPHASASNDQPSGSASDQETQASNSSPSTSDEPNKDSSASSSSSASSASSSSSQDKSDMAPLFIPMNAITPPWFHGSPVFMDPSSESHLSSRIKNKQFSSSSSSQSDSYQHEKGEYTSSSDIAPTYNDPMFNLHGTNGQFLPSSMGYQGYDPNSLNHMSPSQSSDEGNKKDQQSTDENKSQGGRNRYLQPIIDSVQRLLRGPGPLRDIEQNILKQGQRMQASFSNLVPVSISNYTSFLPSLPGLRSSSGNRDRKPSGVSPTTSSTTSTGNRGSRYLDSLRIRLRPLTMMEGNRLTSTFESLWRNIRGRATSSSSSPSPSHQPITAESNTHTIADMNGANGHLNQIHHHQHQLSPVGIGTGAGHPHFNIPGQQNNQVMQQYLEQILTSKWWEWPSGGLLGPNLNQY